jgi:large subunit ribosomal protein L18
MKLALKKKLLQKRRWRIRKKVNGTPDRPRLVVKFTNKHIHAQCVDDVAHKTLLSASTLKKGEKVEASRSNIAGATELGKEVAEKAASSNITSVVFDRAGRRYHGCVKAFAEAAREAGLQF